MENIDTRKEHSHFLIVDEILLYQLSDAGLLDRLYKVLPNKKIEGKRVWLFDKTPDVKAVIDRYITTKRAENKE